MIERGDVAKAQVVAVNHGPRTVELTFVPTCTCLTALPATRAIAPGGRADFDLSFDSKDDEGKTARYFIVKTDVYGAKPLFYVLRGVVRVDKPRVGTESSGAAGTASSVGAASFTAPAEAGMGSIKLSYYYTPGCRSCEEFLSTEIPRLEASYGIRVALERRDLLDSSVYEELSTFASSIGATVDSIPALRIGNTLLQGDKEIRDRLPGLLVTRGRDGSATSTWQKTPGDRSSAGSSINARLAIVP